MRNLALLGAAALFALAGGSVTANEAGTMVMAQNTKPPHISTTGQANRSTTATKKGANQKNFCPPGQARKPGKGSAFNC
jgi:hypothetical protein